MISRIALVYPFFFPIADYAESFDLIWLFLISFYTNKASSCYQEISFADTCHDSGHWSVQLISCSLSLHQLISAIFKKYQRWQTAAPLKGGWNRIKSSFTNPLSNNLQHPSTSTSGIISTNIIRSCKRYAELKLNRSQQINSKPHCRDHQEAAV